MVGALSSRAGAPNCSRSEGPKAKRVLCQRYSKTNLLLRYPGLAPGFLFLTPVGKRCVKTNDFKGETEWFVLARFVCLLLKLKLLHKPKEIQ